MTGAYAPRSQYRRLRPNPLPCLSPVSSQCKPLIRRRAEADARFEAREQAIQEGNSTAVKQWTQKKVKQQREDAEDSYLRQIKLRALAAYQARM